MDTKKRVLKSRFRALENALLRYYKGTIYFLNAVLNLYLFDAECQFFSYSVLDAEIFVILNVLFHPRMRSAVW